MMQAISQVRIYRLMVAERNSDTDTTISKSVRQTKKNRTPDGVLFFFYPLTILIPRDTMYIVTGGVLWIYN